MRAHADPVAGIRAWCAGGELVITRRRAAHGVAPGQTAVIYVGTRVLGQCTIDRTVSAVPAAAHATGAKWSIGGFVTAIPHE